MKKKKALIFLAVLIVIFFIPKVVILLSTRSRIHALTNSPKEEYGILFGAKVYENGELSPIIRERAGAAVQAYKQGVIKKIFISGTNSSNFEVDKISDYVVTQGVVLSDIVKDSLGIDTADTCRHFKNIGNNALLFTKKFHLPRAIYICKKEGVISSGIDVSKVLSSDVEKLGLFRVYAIRTQRLIRESFLSWSYVLGIYNKVSNEAEKIESLEISMREKVQQINSE